MKNLWRNKSAKMFFTALVLALLSGFYREYDDFYCEGAPASYDSFTPDCAKWKYEFDAFSILRNTVIVLVLLEIGTSIERGHRKFERREVPDISLFDRTFPHAKSRDKNPPLNSVQRSCNIKHPKPGSSLVFELGKDTSGRIFRCNSEKTPHLLVGGSTGSGKSQLLHNILFSIFSEISPQEVKLVLVDTKRVEFIGYKNAPHLLKPIIFDPKEAAETLVWLAKEADKKTIKTTKTLLVIDEFSDLIAIDKNAVENSIQEIANQENPANIHMVISTSRVSPQVYTEKILSSIPSRVCFHVDTEAASKMLIRQPGGELLKGKGDMLFIASNSSKPVRLQTPFISGRKIESTVAFLQDKKLS